MANPSQRSLCIDLLSPQRGVTAGSLFSDDVNLSSAMIDIRSQRAMCEAAPS
jgi:hypothetical protein